MERGTREEKAGAHLGSSSSDAPPQRPDGALPYSSRQPACGAAARPGDSGGGSRGDGAGGDWRGEALRGLGRATRVEETSPCHAVPAPGPSAAGAPLLHPPALRRPHVGPPPPRRAIPAPRRRCSSRDAPSPHQPPLSRRRRRLRTARDWLGFPLALIGGARYLPRGSWIFF
jgi:hypothetical protein